MKTLRTLLLVVLIALLCGCASAQVELQPVVLAEVAGPQAWIDAPLPGANLPLAPYEFVAHGSDEAGIQQIEWTLNGALLGAVPSNDPSAKLSTFRLNWQPSAGGTYTLQARVLNGANVWSGFDEVTFTVGEPTSTPTLVPTLTITPTPTLIPTVTPTATATETPTLTPTATPSELVFTPTLSTTTLEYQRDCRPDPGEISLDVSVSDPSRVYSIVLFYRLNSQDGSITTEWNSVAMNPGGSGSFSRTVAWNDPTDYAQIARRGLAAWFVYQFVATDANGEIVGRSQIYSDVTYVSCG